MKYCFISIFSFLLIFNSVSAEEVGTDEKIKRVYELYLQDSTVTLDKNAWRVGLNVSYLHDEKTFGFSHQETRGVSGQLSVNYGVIAGLELYGSIPVLWSNNTFSDALQSVEEKSSEVALGNLQLGMSYNLFPATKEWPAVTAQLSVEVPLGYVDNENVAITAEVTVNQSFDPAFIYGGIYYTKEIGGSTLDGLSYQAGVGFSLNHRLALGLEYSSGYKFNRAAFSSRESSLITMRTIFMFDKNTTIEPRVSFGLNDSAPDSIVGINISRRF